MTRTASPLRYPGGKACLYDLATKFLAENELSQRSYAEPYSGGCGLALSLLYSGHVTQVHLNDLDRSVWAFWTSAIHHTDDLVKRIEDTPVTMDVWERQRSIQAEKSTADVVDLGFSTFFLNRTNRSGIIHSGGVIGGKDQSGPWKMDCRFNRPDLIKRIRRVAQYSNRINLYNEDAEAFLARIGSSIPATTVLYIDPPYFEKGSQLYRNSYRKTDHERIAAQIGSISAPWFLTYDNVPEIADLYSRFASVELDIGYSVQTKRRGSELLVVSDPLRLPVTEMAVAH